MKRCLSLLLVMALLLCGLAMAETAKRPYSGSQMGKLKKWCGENHVKWQDVQYILDQYPTVDDLIFAVFTEKSLTFGDTHIYLLAENGHKVVPMHILGFLLTKDDVQGMINTLDHPLVDKWAIDNIKALSTHFSLDPPRKAGGVKEESTASVAQAIGKREAQEGAKRRDDLTLTSFTTSLSDEDANALKKRAGDIGQVDSLKTMRGDDDSVLTDEILWLLMDIMSGKLSAPDVNELRDAGKLPKGLVIVLPWETYDAKGDVGVLINMGGTLTSAKGDYVISLGGKVEHVTGFKQYYALGDTVTTRILMSEDRSTVYADPKARIGDLIFAKDGTAYLPFRTVVDVYATIDHTDPSKGVINRDVNDTGIIAAISYERKFPTDSRELYKAVDSGSYNQTDLLYLLHYGYITTGQYLQALTRAALLDPNSESSKRADRLMEIYGGDNDTLLAALKRGHLTQSDFNLLLLSGKLPQSVCDAYLTFFFASNDKTYMDKELDLNNCPVPTYQEDQKELERLVQKFGDQDAMIEAYKNKEITFDQIMLLYRRGVISWIIPPSFDDPNLTEEQRALLAAFLEEAKKVDKEIRKRGDDPSVLPDQSDVRVDFILDDDTVNERLREAFERFGGDPANIVVQTEQTEADERALLLEQIRTGELTLEDLRAMRDAGTLPEWMVLVLEGETVDLVKAGEGMLVLNYGGHINKYVGSKDSLYIMTGDATTNRVELENQAALQTLDTEGAVTIASLHIGGTATASLNSTAVVDKLFVAQKGSATLAEGAKVANAYANDDGKIVGHAGSISDFHDTQAENLQAKIELQYDVAQKKRDIINADFEKKQNPSANVTWVKVESPVSREVVIARPPTPVDPNKPSDPAKPTDPLGSATNPYRLTDLGGTVVQAAMHGFVSTNNIPAGSYISDPGGALWKVGTDANGYPEVLPVP